MKLNTFAGLALLPTIDLVIVFVKPLIFLFRGVILKVKILVSAIGPLFIPLTVNLILPSSSTPAADTFAVLKDSKSVPPSSVPTAPTLSSL